MNDDAPRAPGAGRQDLDPAEFMTGDLYEDAITEVVRFILELTSANQALDYPNGARIRGELENALRKAQHTFEAMPDEPARARALHRLDGLRIAAERQLNIAPRGEPTALPREVEQWKAQRLGHGTNPPRPPRRPRSDTRPDTPGAMRIEARDTAGARSHEVGVPVPPLDPALEKEHR